MTSERPFTPDYAVPPGEALKEWLEENQLTTKEFAEKANLGHTLVKLLLIGAYPINDVIAMRLALATEICVQYWMKWEEIYEAELDRLKMERPRP